MREQVGLAPGPAAASVTAVVGGMAVGRLVGGRLALRYPLDTLLYGAIALTGIGFTVFWHTDQRGWRCRPCSRAASGSPSSTPSGVALVINASEGRPDHASARAGIGAALASGVGPFVLGALADVAGLHRALLVVPALLAVAAVGLRLGRLPATPTTPSPSPTSPATT